jgi:hypothetical protein
MPLATIDIASHAFARRFANLLGARRRESGLRLGQMARASEGRFGVAELKAAEAGTLALTEEVVADLAGLYGTDLGTILPVRLPLIIDTNGVIATGGVEARFDPGDTDSLLTAYLRLIRTLRSQQHEPMIDLRHDDVEALARHLHASGADVVERLGALMGATRSQRRSMAKMFLAGAMVVGLATVAPATRVAAAPAGPTGDTRVAPVVRLVHSSGSPRAMSTPTLRYRRSPIYVSPVVVGSDAWIRANDDQPPVA